MPARRPGRKRKLDAKRRNRRNTMSGPTPEIARRRLAEAGLILPVEAFGAGVWSIEAIQQELERVGLARQTGLAARVQAQALLDESAKSAEAHRQAMMKAGGVIQRPLAPAAAIVAKLRLDAEAQRLPDAEVMRIWWEKQPSVDRECPLDVLASRLLISPTQRAAGMRYGRLVWRMAGLPFHPVEKLYRRVGAVPDDDVRPTLSDDEREEAEMNAEGALRDAVFAVQTKARKGALEVLGLVAAYFKAPWDLNAPTAVIRRDARFLELVEALDATASAWGWSQERAG